MLRPKIGLDWDDVTVPFNSIAIKMANDKYQIKPPLTLEDIDSWENTGRAGVIKEFYKDNELYCRQQVPDRNKEVVRMLMEIADVYFITAVYPEFMGIRARQIMDAFPELPAERIILGAAKSLVQFDIVLDDAIHNVLDTPATYPVLLRKPWNRKMTGLLSVNTLDEFYVLVKQIMESSTKKPDKLRTPMVLALVGASGSGKTKIVEDLCKDDRFSHVMTYCTKPSPKHRYVSEQQFDACDFFEKTIYAGVRYGTRQEDIAEALSSNKFVVMPLDMCGAIAMKRKFPTSIIYIDNDKETLIKSIIDGNESTEEKALRILGIDAERRNRSICDYVVSNRDGNGAKRIYSMIG